MAMGFLVRGLEGIAIRLSVLVSEFFKFQISNLTFDFLFAFFFRF